MSSDDYSNPSQLRLPESKIVRLSDAAWKCKEQREAEGIAIRACVAYAAKGVPVEHNGVISVRIDSIKSRMLCLVRANCFLVRLRIKGGIVIAIKSVKIANQP